MAKRTVIKLEKTAATWHQHVVEALAALPEPLAAHYRARFAQHAAWWASHGFETIPDEMDSRLETQGKAPSWRRFAKVLAYQDIHCSLIGYGPTSASRALEQTLAENASTVTLAA